MNEIKLNSNIPNFYNGSLMQSKLNNPLGSHRGTQTITGVYYSFPNANRISLSKCYGDCRRINFQRSSILSRSGKLFCRHNARFA